MADIESLSDAQAILLACELCAASNVAALPRLQQRYPTSLTAVRLFRILLTFLPESTPPQQYVAVLDDIDRGTAGAAAFSRDIDASKVKAIEEPAAWKRVRRLRLLPLRYPHADNAIETTDALTEFLNHRAHRIDTETGLQTYILELILPFYDRSETLRRWLVSKILPLLRSNYEYYPDKEDIIPLSVLESMDRITGINVLLSMTGATASVTDLTRNLRGLVGPWMCGGAQFKRRRLSHAPETNEAESLDWEDVNDWLLSRSLVEFESVANALIDWDGPEDVDLGGYMDTQHSSAESDRLRKSYGQAGLAIIYAADPAKSSLERLYQIASKVARLLQIDSATEISFDDPSLSAVELDLTAISAASKASLLQNALLRGDNALTIPSSQSIAFLQTVLRSARILREFGYITSCRSAATMCLHGNEEAQSWEINAVLDMIVKQPKPGQDWGKIRGQMLWLRDWRGSSEDTKVPGHGLFWRVPKAAVETEILKAMITIGEYRLAADIYTEATSPLDSSQVEAAIVGTIITFYDTASNGNKTRGKMKKAVEILNSFHSHFPDSTRFKELVALISATHALSFYSLTLQHGVPFQPVSIRVHADPLNLIEKVLEQNQNSYTKLDDLLSIGRNFVTAGLIPAPPSPSGDDDDDSSTLSQEQVLIIAERRIISMAVSSALKSDDFGTAYSYILTRLTPPSLMPSSSSTSPCPVEEDISWRAAYNAGRYRPPTTTTEQTLTSQIHNLSQRMELLSLALILAPTADPLPEVLGAWRRCDEEMSILRAREIQEAEEWDLKGDQTTTTTTIPGGFGPSDQELDAYENANRQRSRSYYNKYNNNNITSSTTTRNNNEEAPMGLFDVARGAARAFSKNIPPLQRQQQQQRQSRLPSGHDHYHDHAEGAEGEGLTKSLDSLLDGAESSEPGRERVRKRDVVSSMVTGGLASGIGWVLGAQPVNNR